MNKSGRDRLARPALEGEAEEGSLAPGALADLIAVRNFMTARQTALAGLFGRKLPPSFLREELTRAVVIEFGFGRSRTIAHYVGACAAGGSPAEVDSELRLLEELGLVLLPTEGKDPRGGRVVPTKKLIDWYSKTMPRLMEEVSMALEARSASSGLI